MCIEENFKLEYEIIRNKEQLFNINPLDIDIIIFNMLTEEYLSIFKIASNIRKNNERIKIIFISSRNDKDCTNCMLEGYKIKVFRCLLKPITYSAIKEAISICIYKISRYKMDYIFIKYNNSLHKIYVKKIKYIKVEKNILIINTVDDIFLTYESLSVLESKLSKNNFFRCHNSYLINISYINLIEKDLLKLGDDLIPISKYRYKNLNEKFQYILPKLFY